MPLDVQQDEIIVKTRDEWLALYLRSHQLRSSASVAQGSEPYVSGAALADQLNLMSENARQIGRSIPLASIAGKKLDALLAALGLPSRFPQTGSQGAVIADTSLNGSTVPAETEGTDDDGQVYYCTTTRLYVTGQSIPIAARSTGPTTNLAAGKKITWSAPPPGLFPRTTVFRQTDGSGLSGGRLAETDDEVRNRISDSYANPAAAGNAAQYIATIEFSQGHGVAVQKAFVYPAILGPGTIAFCFTLSPARPGASRLPNITQIDQVLDFVAGLFPGDDSVFACLLLSQPTDIAVRLIWADGADSWVDAVPWPPYYTSDGTPAAMVVTAATNPIAFAVDCLGGARTGAVPPQVGNNIGVYDPTSGSFLQKRILTVTGTGPWALGIDTTNGVSDTAFTPDIGSRVSPWSDSLDTVIPAVVDYLGTMGPGEQLSTFFDPGLRQKRAPATPRFWPATITNRLASDILKLPSIGDASVVEGLNATTTVGVPGATSYLIELKHLSVFPL